MAIEDKAQFGRSHQAREAKHHYGEHFHLLADAFHFQLLNNFCLKETVQPVVNRLVSGLYRFLAIEAINQCFPKAKTVVKTRMNEASNRAEFSAEKFEPKTKAVVVDVMRAGILPSHATYEVLHEILPAELVRQDHILMDRKTNDKGEVVGTHLSGHKIGGPVEDAFVFIPDPMGATGGSVASVIELYEKLMNGKKAKKFIALHLIVTPEYLKRVQSLGSKLEVFALRVDRGLSSDAILKTELGERWSEEKGLNDKQYIVPGAGGIGEILNNSFV